MTEKTRIVLADDHPIVLDGLRNLIRAERDFELVGEAASGLSALKIIREQRPDVAVLDISMPELNGILLSRRLKRHTNALAAVGAWIFVMHFVDVYWQVLPVHDEAGARPDWLDLGAVTFVGGLACACVVRRYVTAAPVPLYAPELADGLKYEAAI